MNRSGKTAILFLIIAASISMVSTQCSTPTDKIAADTLLFRNMHDSVQYVGIQTCRECHSSIYDSYLETGMGKSFEHASLNKSAAGKGPHKPVYDKYSDLYYLPSWENDKMILHEFRLEGRDTIHSRKEEIKYIIGSGQHTNSHMVDFNNYVFQAPLTFYTQDGKWDLPPGFENGKNTRFKRMIGLECMSCHNGYPGFAEGSINKFTFVPNGIDCERCHGPGSIHVREKKEGKIIDISKEADRSIVNPAKLTAALQMEICQRCHIQGNAVLKDGKSFYDFRPGMKLSQIMDVYMPVYVGKENEFIMASHVERLKKSSCYIKTTEKIESGAIKPKDALRPFKDALTCVTCHNPHISVKKTEKEIFNAACKNCHGTTGSSGCSESAERRLLKKNDCTTCHMPKSGTVDIPHVTSTDHYIRKPIKEEEIEQVRKFLTLKAINNPSPSRISKGRAFINYFEKFENNPAFLDSALIYFSTNDKRNFADLVRIYYLKNEFQKVIELCRSVSMRPDLLLIRDLENKDAWTNYRIGESYFKIGDFNSALSYYKQAKELAPFHPDMMLKYGVALQATGNLKESRKVFEFMIIEFPKYSAAYSNLGYLNLTMGGNIKDSEKMYNQALHLDPDYIPALLNKAGLMAFIGNRSESVKLLKRIIKLEPGNADAAQALQKLVP